MPKKHTFRPLARNGARMPDDVTYSPLIFIAGTQAHHLALHMSPAGIWTVSDPISGACVIREVGGFYKGIPVSSRGANVRQARQAAAASLDALCERIGSAAFNARLAAAREHYGAPAD